MTARCRPLDAVIDHVRAVGATSVGRRAVSGWGAAEPVLAGYGDAAGLAAHVAAASPADRDGLLAALLRVADGDELAQLVVVAALAGRLRRVVAGWARAGVPAGELAELEAGVVAECWVAVAAAARAVGGGGPLPPRPGLGLVDRAHEAVRVERRRQRRHAARHVPLDPDGPAALGDPGGRACLELLAAAVLDAVRVGRLSVPAARLVFATRVAGWSVEETAAVMGCSSPGVAGGVGGAPRGYPLNRPLRALRPRRRLPRDQAAAATDRGGARRGAGLQRVLGVAPDRPAAGR